MLPKANRYTPHLFEVLQADIEQDLKKKNLSPLIIKSIQL